MDQGTYLLNEDKLSCHSCMNHSMLTCSIILPSIIKIFLMVTEETNIHHFNNQIFPSENLVKNFKGFGSPVL